MRVASPIHWDPPPEKVFKLNFDGASKGNPKMAGFVLGAFMDLLQTLILARTLNDRHLFWTQFKIYGMARGIVGLAVRQAVSCVLVHVFYRFSVGKNLPHRIGFRLKLAAMSRRRGTPRRANSGHGKSQRGCSA